MTFVVGKLAWLVLQPSNFLVLGLLLSLIFGLRRLALTLALVLAAVVVLPVGLWLQRPLEDRFARPSALPDEIDGIIVLGGAQDPEVTAVHNAIALNDAAERMVEGQALAYRYPDARLVFSGGNGKLLPDGTLESTVDKRFVELVQLDEDRVIYEDRSRNTWENALYSHELIAPGADEIWVLVTSAAHMPRSMGVFREIGWDVVPWPVDYRTSADHRPELQTETSLRLNELDDAVREWLGLVYYRLLGQTPQLLPGPRSAG